MPLSIEELQNVNRQLKRLLKLAVYRDMIHECKTCCHTDCPDYGKMGDNEVRQTCIGWEWRDSQILKEIESKMQG